MTPHRSSSLVALGLPLALALLAPAAALGVQEPAAAAASSPAPAPGSGEGGAADLSAALIAAAQRGDLAEAKRLLDAGAAVDSRTRYGATPLAFACDRGNVELVRLLLERGADADAADRFYGFTPLQWALYSAGDSEPHREILRLLLPRAANGTAEVTAVLLFGVEQGDPVLVRAAVEDGGAAESGLRAALAAAREADRAELVSYLDQRVAAEPAAGVFRLPAEALGRYAGVYASDELGFAVEVSAEGGTLRLAFPEQPPSTLAAHSEESFEILGAPGMTVRFAGGAEAMETLSLVRGGRETVLVRRPAAAAAEPAAGKGASAGATTAGAGEAPAAGGPGRAPASGAAGEASAPDDEAAATTAPAPPTAAEPAATGRAEARPWPAFRGADRAGIGDGQGAPAAWDAPGGAGLAWKTPIPGLGLSSPVVWGDRVFVTTAVSDSGDDSIRTGIYGDVDSVEDRSHHAWKVYALDLGTGVVVWERVAAEGPPQVKRHLKSSHANPTPATDGERVVVGFGSEGLFCYGFDGRLLWRKDLGVLSSGWFYDPTYEWGFGSSPILHDGAVIVQVDVQQGSFIAALDAVAGRELWRTGRDEIPTWGTPVVLPGGDGPDEIVTNGTTVRGYDAATGRELWRLGPNSEITVASPVAADGRLYFTAEDGTTYVVAAGRAFRLLATNQVGEPVLATPAISDGLVLIRGKGHLFALGEPPAGPGETPGGAGEAPSDPGGEAAGAGQAAAGPAEERPSENAAGGAR